MRIESVDGMVINKILIVDDDELFAETFHRILEFNGYSVETAGTGMEAL